MSYLPRTLYLLEKAGMAPRELDALSCRPLHTLPACPSGFGLVGPPGTGKTWGLAHYIAGMVDGFVRRQPDPDKARLTWIDGEIVRDRSVIWLNWHAEVEAIHRRRFDDRWVDDRASLWEDVTFLVVDDLGRERYEGAKDPAREVLARVLDERYRRKLPLFWTSNLETKEVLEGFYHEALVSRLIGTWPPFQVEGKDHRLFPLEDMKMAAGGDR